MRTRQKLVLGPVIILALVILYSYGAVVGADEPDIPTMVDELYFGVPAGNGHRPAQVAVDGQNRRLYTLKKGLASDKVGNTVSVIDLAIDQVVNLLELNNWDPDLSWPPDPVDLQADPYRPRLYALTGDRYADTSAVALTVIDAESLAVVETIPAVEAVVPGPDRLYLANDTRLWAVDPLTLQEVASQALEPGRDNAPLLLNSQANRLYLGRGSRSGSVETFQADSLAPVGSYALEGELVELLLDEANQRLVVVENDGSRISAHLFDNQGQPLAGPLPVVLKEDTYSSMQLALAGPTLYVVDRGEDTYRLRAFNLATSGPTGDQVLPLDFFPQELVVDTSSGLLYGAYNSPGSYALRIDPAEGTTGLIYTAHYVLDALVDEQAGRLYVLDDGGGLRVLNLADYEEITRQQTGLQPGYYGFSGQLALDRGRQRLYLGGQPVRVVDTASWEARSYPDLEGQITADPTTDRLYLTAPCSCRMEQCNTRILNADTMRGSETVFPPQDALVAPCVLSTDLDAKNQLLYATISNGVPGSNGGSYLMMFDTQPTGVPERLYTAGEISFGDVALDRQQGRAFASRYRHDRAYIHRFELQPGRSLSQTMELSGAGGQLAYDSAYDRLYVLTTPALQVFDGSLTLLTEIALPEQEQLTLLDFDSEGQRLYLAGENGQVLVVATGGGPQPQAGSRGQ